MGKEQTHLEPSIIVCQLSVVIWKRFGDSRGRTTCTRSRSNVNFGSLCVCQKPCPYLRTSCALRYIKKTNGQKNNYDINFVSRSIWGNTELTSLHSTVNFSNC
ncbi:hypothetical protein AVEN_126086-1 [Araneus ventricosus]|uniref:Uncharacterized protein n=1 Tax=Araneus ventricosus TaxID=182803 RepID=A0A4Y2CKQ5_ARAVE|nr:hypothetical protein AVEN_126086-1 [Araneus ventricosus]